MPDSFGYLCGGNVLRVVPVRLAILVSLTLLTGFILKYTRLGRSVNAIGSNMEAARLSAWRG